MFRLRSLQDVVDWGLCTGCGACVTCHDGIVSLVNFEAIGIRPLLSRSCLSCTDCFEICPGMGIAAELTTRQAKDSLVEQELGSVLEIWEGHAADPEIRYRGSSGGVLSALALYCLEQESMSFVLHTASDPQKPWLNRTVQSRTRTDLLTRAGSRYAPASPCEGLSDLKSVAGQLVFIGKPCDTAATMQLTAHRPDLHSKIGLVLSCFCAGTPSTQGTLELLKQKQVPLERVKDIRYRGNGWPGCFEVAQEVGSGSACAPYDEAWAFLTRFVPFRCRICPDGFGRVADIACGDAWEKHHSDSKNPGCSIVIVRTVRGQEILQRAIAKNYVKLTPAAVGNVFAAQKELFNRRREVFGRIVGLRLWLRPAPVFKHFSLFRSWMRLPAKRKIATIVGTVVRVGRRGLWRRRTLPYQMPDVD